MANLNNKKPIALILTIVILTSIINFEYTRLSDNSINKQNVNNYNECYFDQEFINLIEEKTKNESNNLQLHRSKSKVISNYYNKHIVGSICSITNIYKLKYTADINELFNIYCDSVFVVSYIHKKDGKKHFNNC